MLRRDLQPDGLRTSFTQRRFPSSDGRTCRPRKSLDPGLDLHWNPPPCIIDAMQGLFDKTSINRTNEMQIIAVGIKPVIQVQKSLGLLKEEKLLSFAGPSFEKFTTSCERGGGAAFEADGRWVCGASKFDVQKYLVCLRPLCGGVNTDESRAVVESRLHEQLVNFGQHIKNKTACNFSSAVRLCVSACSVAFTAILFGMVTVSAAGGGFAYPSCLHYPGLRTLGT